LLRSPPFHVVLIVTDSRNDNHPARPYFSPRKTLPEKAGRKGEYAGLGIFEPDNPLLPDGRIRLITRLCNCQKAPDRSLEAGVFVQTGERSGKYGDQTMNGETVKKSNKVSFQIVAAPGSAVFVAGTFNNWDPVQYRLRDHSNSGSYQSEMTLPPGRHEYKKETRHED
jgi:hypothetical protein